MYLCMSVSISECSSAMCRQCTADASSTGKSYMETRLKESSARFLVVKITWLIVAVFDRRINI